MATAYTPMGNAPAGGSFATGDANVLSSTYNMTAKDLATKVAWGGKQVKISDIIHSFETFTPAQLNQWQSVLLDTGLLKAGSAGDPVSLSDAFNSLLRYAAYNKEDPKVTATRMSQLAKKTAGAGTGAKVTVDLTNPVDVQYAANVVAQKLVGRDLTPEEATAIATDMRSQEMASGTAKAQAQLSQIDATMGQGAGSSSIVTNVQPETVDAATQQYLAKNAPGDYQGHQLLNVFQAIKTKVATDAQGSGPKAAAGPIRTI